MYPSLVNNIGLNNCFGKKHLLKTYRYLIIVALSIMSRPMSAQAPYNAMANKILSDSFFNLGQYDKYHELNLLALEQANQGANCMEKLNALYAVAASYYYLQNKEQSKIYFIKALQLPCATDTFKGRCNRSLGAIWVEEKNTDSAQYYLSQAAQYFKKAKTNDDLILLYGIWFELAFKQQHHLLLSQQMLDSCAKYSFASSNASKHFFYYIKKGIFETETGRPQAAIMTLKKCEQIALADKAPENMMYALICLAKAQQLAHQPDQAYNTLLRHNSIRDSVFKAETARNMAQYSIQFKTKEKELENFKLKQNNKIIMLLAAFTILLLLVFFVFFFTIQKTKKEKQHQQALRQEQENSFKEIYNTQESERARIAADLHDGTGYLLSALQMNVSLLQANTPSQTTLVKNITDLVSSAAKEIREVSHRLMPQSLINIGLVASIQEIINRIPDATNKTITFNHSFDEDLFRIEIKKILYRIAQELINNSLKHAQAQNIKVDLLSKNTQIIFTVEDDGVGFVNNPNTPGIGHKNIQSKLNIFNGHLKVESTPNKGCKITIAIETAA